jgi:C4-dicarboxylate-specific signal transduction histidine kinase
MSKKQPASIASISLERALDQNEAVQETIEQSACELFVINAVLKQEIPGHAQNGEVAQALLKTDELEDRIQSSADDLARVNQVLKQEIIERTELERQLAQTQAALDQVQSKVHAPGQANSRSATQ